MLLLTSHVEVVHGRNTSFSPSFQSTDQTMHIARDIAGTPRRWERRLQPLADISAECKLRTVEHVSKFYLLRSRRISHTAAEENEVRITMDESKLEYEGFVDDDVNGSLRPGH